MKVFREIFFQNFMFMKKAGEIAIHTDELDHLGVSIKSIDVPPEVIEGAHRDDHYMFIVQQAGEFTLEIDFDEVVIRGAAICFVAPGQVHKYVKWSGEQVWFLCADVSQVSEANRDIFDSYPQVVSIPEQDIIFKALPILDQLLQDRNQLVVPHQLAAILGMMAAAILATQAKKHPFNSQRYHIVHQFRQLTREKYKDVKQVQQYASLLNITPLYLNEVVKEVTGFPASYWIQQEIMLEAKRLLYYTVNDVKQIAYELGYEDHAYFSRFFKKNTGITPLTFRDKNHELSNHTR